jgi:transcription termination/antitermination protein NusG
MQHVWYVVQVFSGHEKKIKRVLEEGLKDVGPEENISEFLLPTEKVIEVKGGEQKIFEKKLWPGYLLVKMELTDAAWTYMKSVNGVIGFLGGETPVPLTEAEVENILKELADKKDTPIQKQSFATGERVKIIDGVFINFLGTITEVNNEKGLLNVMVAIFDRDTPVNDLEFWQVELLTEEDNNEEVKG